MKLPHNDIFFQFPRHTVPTSQGDVTMPILYYDASQWLFIFKTDKARVQQLLPDGLKAVSVGGKGLAGVAFYEYRDTSIGVYNEAGIALGCLPNSMPTPATTLPHLMKRAENNTIGFHVIDLPVTTQAACSAGRDIWSFPKIVTNIGYQENGSHFSGHVALPDNSGNILSISGRSGPSFPWPVIDLVLYSRHQKNWLRTLVNTHGTGRICTGGSLRLQVENTDHPMGKHLDLLGLNQKKPFMVIRSTELQLRLNSGAVMP